MANVTIMDLPAVSALTGDEVIEVVQPGTSNGTSKRATVADIRGTGAYTNLAVTGTLTVGGATTLSSTLSSTLAVTGATTLTGAVTVSTTLAVDGQSTFSELALFRPQADPDTWLQMDPSDISSSELQPWIFGVASFPNATHPLRLQTYTNGVNVSAANLTLLDSDYPGVAMRWELQYEDGSGDIHDEWHLTFVEKTSGTQVRWISGEVLNDDVDTTSAAFSVGTFRMYEPDGVTQNVLFNWVSGSEEFYFTLPALTAFAFYGNGDTNGADGQIQFWPTSAAGVKMQFIFAGGSGEIFGIYGAGGFTPDRVIIGTGATGGDGGVIQIRDNSGAYMGIGLDPGASGIAGGLYTQGRVVKLRVVTAAGAVTIATTDDTVVVNKTVGAATTVNLPATPATGLRFTIKDGKGDAGVNNITVTPAAGTIDGSGTLVIRDNYAAVTLEYNGTEWNVISRY